MLKDKERAREDLKEGLVAHAGGALLAGVAEKTGLMRTLCSGLTGMRRRRGGHAPGRVIRDPAVG